MKKRTPSMGNVTVQIEHAMLTRGYRPEKDFMRDERHWVFLAKPEHGGERVLVKATGAELEMDNILNEALAHEFLNKRRPSDAPFLFPVTEIVEYKDVLVTMTPFQSGKPFIVQGGDVEGLFQIMLFLHQIPRAKVPEFFLGRGRREFGPERVLERMWGYLESAIGPVITRGQATALEHLMRNVGMKRRFVHHDLSSGSLLRLADGRLLVTNAEFARWGMKWYDVAYASFQIPGLLQFLISRFKRELPGESIEEEILFPLGYVIAMECHRAAVEPAKREHARKAIEHILRRNLRFFLR